MFSLTFENLCQGTRTSICHSSSFNHSIPAAPTHAWALQAPVENAAVENAVSIAPAPPTYLAVQLHRLPSTVNPTVTPRPRTSALTTASRGADTCSSLPPPRAAPLAPPLRPPPPPPHAAAAVTTPRLESPLAPPPPSAHSAAATTTLKSTPRRLQAPFTAPPLSGAAPAFVDSSPPPPALATK